MPRHTVGLNADASCKRGAHTMQTHATMAVRVTVNDIWKKNCSVINISLRVLSKVNRKRREFAESDSNNIVEKLNSTDAFCINFVLTAPTNERNEPINRINCVEYFMSRILYAEQKWVSQHRTQCIAPLIQHGKMPRKRDVYVRRAHRRQRRRRWPNKMSLPSKIAFASLFRTPISRIHRNAQCVDLFHTLFSFLHVFLSMHLLCTACVARWFGQLLSRLVGLQRNAHSNFGLGRCRQNHNFVSFASWRSGDHHTDHWFQRRTSDI